MATTHEPVQGPSPRPYDRPHDRPEQFEMSGGSGAYPGGPPHSPSRPWDDPYPRPGSEPTLSNVGRPYSAGAGGMVPPAPAPGVDYPRPPRPGGAADYYDYHRPDHQGPFNGPMPNPADPNAPRPPGGGGGPPTVLEEMPGPAGMPPPSHGGSIVNGPHGAQAGLMNPTATGRTDLRSVKATCLYSLREYATLQKKRQGQGLASANTSSLELENQIRHQAGRALGELSLLREQVSVLVKESEGHRWRRWLVGGAIASFIPALKYIIPTVKSLFRRTPEQKSEDTSVTDTEHAFGRARDLLSRIKDSVLGKSSFASMTFLVFAVMYIFSNEVSLMVGKTVNKRLKRLTAKLERGDEQVTEKDLKMLEGWRWRVLLWK